MIIGGSSHLSRLNKRSPFWKLRLIGHLQYTQIIKVNKQNPMQNRQIVWLDPETTDMPCLPYSWEVTGLIENTTQDTGCVRVRLGWTLIENTGYSNRLDRALLCMARHITRDLSIKNKERSNLLIYDSQIPHALPVRSMQVSAKACDMLLIYYSNTNIVSSTIVQNII